MNRSLVVWLWLSIALAAAPLPLQAQSAPEKESQELLRLFLDCPDFYCDPDFYRTELAFVSHVRNRQDADMHLLITSQGTGGGGREFTLNFIGQRRFQGMADTLRYVSPTTATEDEQRRGLARSIKLGMARYVASTPAGTQLEISYAPSSDPTAAKAAEADPWNHWTFRMRVGGFFNGESRYQSQNLNGSVSASRTTADWKTRLSAETYYHQSTFDLGGGRTVRNIQRNHTASALTVRSLGPHLSLGLHTEGSQSAYLNQELALRGAPAVEYSVYPYSESTRRQLTVRYSLGVNQVEYMEETLFDKLEERLYDQRLEGSLDTKQPWGSLSLSVEGSHYLHDFDQNRLQLGSDLELRVVKGLSLNLWGRAQRIRDQLHLPKGDLTEEEILLRQRQLATTFRYFGSVGLSYSFGSIYNNVVNPRFKQFSGGM